MGLGADPDADEKPDVWQLFRHYDKLYFRGALVNAAFTLEWTSPRTNNIKYVGLSLGHLMLLGSGGSCTPAVSF
jgi:hypothetical protein